MLKGLLRAATVPLALSALIGCTLAKPATPIVATVPQAVPDLTPEQLLGKAIFFDDALSQPAGQSCSSCHAPRAGFASPPEQMQAGISRGVSPLMGSQFGPRNAPTAAYALFSPRPHFDLESGTTVGGQFLDQRAANLEEQASDPFLNPVEMNNPNRWSVVNKLSRRPYADRFRSLYGAQILSDVDAAYVAMTRAIAAYERSSEFRPFSSKFDAYIRGRASLSPAELRGLAVFRDANRGNCEACHPSTGNDPLFTDFTNDNIGTPRNPSNSFYTQNGSINPDGAGFIDRGLGITVQDAAFDGRFKVPTLRNIALTGPYMHNGVFTTLTEVVRFYNTACTPGNPDAWGAPEIAETQNCAELGDPGLSDQELSDLVVFLHTLTDGYLPR